jgi:DNA-binding transcriptional ArsR family regulator
MLDELLLGRTRAAVLRELYANPDRRISFNELVRRLKSGPGAISRELALLTEAGLVIEQREGNQRFLSAGATSPVFAEIRAFITKASGAPSIVREALRAIEGSIDVAVIIGSVASGTERADSDLDLFVVGSAGYSVVTEHLYPLQDRLGRKVQVLYFEARSAADRTSLRRPATRALLSGPKLFVLGDERTLEGLMSREDEHGQKTKSRKPHKGRKARAARRRA